MKRLFLIAVFLFHITAFASDTTYIDGAAYDNFEITDWVGMGAPSVSPSGQGRIYFDSSANLFKASENGGAYANLIATGDVSGPASSTDNAIARFDGTGGKTLQDSSILIDDSNNVTGMGTLSSGAITTSGLTLTGDITATTAGGLDINLGLSAGDDFTIDTSTFVVEGDTGNVGIGPTGPTAVLHLKAGTATASTAPLKFTSGTNLTTPEAGVMEFNGTDLFFTPSATRLTTLFKENIDTYSELNTIVADATLTHNGLIDTYSELNTIVADVTLTHNGLIDTFAELDTIVADKALVNKADGAVWLGVHDFGGTTSTEIVNGTNPTTDAAGEIAIDTNHSAYGALEIYGATGSAIIPALHKAAATIYDPDTIQATEDAIPLLFVADDWAPHGITIVDIHLSADASNSGSYALEEWTSPTALGSTIETVAFSAATTAEDDGTLADSAVATNAWVFLNLDTTALNFLHVEFTYIVNEGA